MTALFAQIIGYVAMATVFCSFQVKDSRKTLWVMAAAMTLFSLHFGLSGAITGAIQNILGVIRNLCIIYTNPRKTSGKIIKIAVLASFVIAPFAFLLIPGVKVGVLDYILGGFMAISAYLFWSRRESLIRVAQFFLISPSWMIYNILAGSVPGILTETFNLLSVLIYWARQALSRSKKSTESEK